MFEFFNFLGLSSLQSSSEPEGSSEPERPERPKPKIFIKTGLFQNLTLKMLK
ncbi:MAG: hypothetical protein WC650_05340 [Candidatus Doudnabacteria bacterium]